MWCPVTGVKIIPPPVSRPQNTSGHTDRKSIVTPPTSRIRMTRTSGTIDQTCSRVRLRSIFRVFLPTASI
ncbi:hypothetical protein [Acutalibacter caecimuris]|uniref:hypothetical protein n=1 Tax=Acutalibacter caecimuris TaxID=3093657 RepID=UPI002AC89672|nr:hypothetical protein [Acutalibacter sp. M00118]